MSDKIFLDTNILIYCYTTSEPEKQAIAQSVASQPLTIISTQVLKEFANILYKKFHANWQSVIAARNEVESNFQVVGNSPESIRNACKIAEKYSFSSYDSLIIATALESDCKILYSEDLQHNQLIEEILRIKNPFGS
ncbi:MAG: PIN domain-containing protein [Bacteroidia bacterium]